MNEPWWTNRGQFRAFPYMAIEHAEIIRRAIPDHPCVVIEWGVGGSTLWFLQILPPASIYFGFDHDPIWFRKVYDAFPRLAKAGLADRSITTHFECLSTLDPLPPVLRAAHLMLIDCRDEWRAAILDMADDQQLLLPNGHVFLHDAQRPQYREAIIRYQQRHGAVSRHTDSIGVELWHGRNTPATGEA